MAGISDKKGAEFTNCVTSDKPDLLSDLFYSTLKTNANDGSYRLADYKCRIREESDQEARRRKLLLEQKE